MFHSVRNTLSLVFRSLVNRRGTAFLTLASIAVSAALLSVVDRVRTDTQTSFANTISGTDLIVGARSGDLNLLLYSVFRIGSPTNNIAWESYKDIDARPEVDWTIPISLGDAHRGFRVLGTDLRYFEYYKYADERALEFAAGTPFSGPTDAVIGAEVAGQLQYQVGQQIVVSHGLTETSFVTHDENPFTVTGILARTGTPVDRTVHISLNGMDLIHSDGNVDLFSVPIGDYESEAITAFLVGLKSKIGIFSLQRYINEFEPEPLSAVIPGVALQQLWGLIGVAEYALFGVSAMVVLAGVLGLLATLLVSLNERRREMSVLRSVGARPGHVFALLLSEAAMLAFLGALLGLLMVQVGILAIRQYALSEFGIQLSVGLRAFDLYVLAGILSIAVLVSTIPAWRAYRNSLADGLTVRL
ncbi:MAG: ABC transporter permease [Woeseiaceae bacterium]|nr:ABC transporter permease [Woeseiaceae bacterium]